MITYSIIHDYLEEPDRRLILCADGYFRAGVASGFGKTDTKVYKRLCAARKRLRKVCKVSFPRASVFIHK